MATSTITVPSRERMANYPPALAEAVVALATAAKADVEGFEGSSLADTTPAAEGVAATAGVDVTASRADHVHAWSQVGTHDFDATITGSADTDGTATSPIDVGAALPARAIILAVEVKLGTAPTGGGIANLKLDLGWAGATEALIKDLELVALAAGSYDQNQGGTINTKVFPVQAGGKTIQAILTPDGSTKVSEVTAFALTINVYYVVPF